MPNWEAILLRQKTPDLVTLCLIVKIHVNLVPRFPVTTLKLC